MTGIIGAMEKEMHRVIEAMTEVECQTVAGITFHRGLLCGKPVVAAISGIGKVFAALCTQSMILLYHPDCIVNIGIAGSLSGSLAIGGLALADRLVQHDMDTTPIGDPPGLISGLNLVHLPCDRERLVRWERTAEAPGVPSEIGTIASGDCFMSDPARKEWIRRTFGAIACEMEGAAVGQVCFVNDVPCNVMRVISDRGGEDSGREYAENAERTSAFAFTALCAYLTLD